jgi:hypothetical protein
MKNLTFTPEPVIAEQLQELARITQRPIGDLINDLLDSPLDQMLGEQQDTDYMRLVLEDVVYPDRSQAEIVAENYNALNRATVREHGQFHVRTARATDACTVEFTEPELVEA